MEEIGDQSAAGKAGDRPVGASQGRPVGASQGRPVDASGQLDGKSSAGLAPARCGHCRDRRFAFDGVTALWLYQDCVRDAVVAAKYPSHAALGEVLGRRLGQQVVSHRGYERPDFVTYTPSHLRRQIARGGNGVEVMAKAVSRVVGSPCRSIVRLNRPISKQAWLDDEQRQQNVRGAFGVKKSYACCSRGGISDSHVLLVDDVLTTGATAGEIAGLLGCAGARRVSLAVVARAVRGS